MTGENKMTIETATATLDDDKLLESVSMQDLALYAKELSNKNDIFIPPSAKASKEDLINWISNNDPSHNPEAE